MYAFAFLNGLTSALQVLGVCVILCLCAKICMSVCVCVHDLYVFINAYAIHQCIRVWQNRVKLHPCV